jgi:hypothetical protein
VDCFCNLQKNFCGKDGQLSNSDNLYSMLTEVNPKQYSRLMGGTAVYIAIKWIRGIPWEEAWLLLNKGQLAGTLDKENWQTI